MTMNSDTPVRNQHPTVPNMPPGFPGAARLAIVGESPGVEEVSWAICASGHGFALEHWQNRQLVTRDRCSHCGSTSFTPMPRPFVGESGRLLDTLLKDAGLPRERCFIGNASQYPLSEGEKDLDHCRGGLARLWRDLETFKPTLVLCLGGLSLSAFHMQGADAKISNWRGSKFTGELDGWITKYPCMAALHPAAVLREPSQTAILRFDIAKAVREATTPSAPVQRVIDAPSDVDELCAKLAMLRQAAQPLGYDLEGDYKCVTVCSFGMSPTHALSIPLRRMDWSCLWSTADEERIVRAIGNVLEDAAVPKVGHNIAYEAFTHRWLYGHRLRSPDDSMIAFNCMWPELDKNLSVVASLLTNTDYWGEHSDQKTQPDRDTYNAIDSCVCLEAWERLMAEFTPAQLSYYRTQCDLLEPCGAMSFDGMLYDAPSRDALVASLQSEVYAVQGKLDALAGIPRPSFNDVAEAVALKVKRDRIVDWSDILLYARPKMRENL